MEACGHSTPIAADWSRREAELNAHVPMLEAHSEKVNGDAIKMRVRWQGASISTGATLELCRSDDEFRAQLIGILAGAPFEAYFWETPPVTASTLGRPFEFVLSDAPALAKAAPDLDAFRRHFDRDGDHDGVVVFENLGRDATLVVPRPLASTDTYVHLGAFLRGAPEAQTHARFRCVAQEVVSRVSDCPLWLSTAGMGVFWLHVRLDSRPKYYRHTPYTVADVS